MKQCKHCEQFKPLSEFHKHPQTADSLDPRCKSCLKRYAQDRRAAGLVDHTKYNVRKNSGISMETYGKMLEAQDGRCAICRKLASEETKAFAVDHDHGCCGGRTSCSNCLRGLLCMKCNLALGHFNDDPELLLAALSYLENHQAGLDSRMETR